MGKNKPDSTLFFLSEQQNIHASNIPNLLEANMFSLILLNMKTVETLSCLISNKAIIINKG